VLKDWCSQLSDRRKKTRWGTAKKIQTAPKVRVTEQSSVLRKSGGKLLHGGDLGFKKEEGWTHVGSNKGRRSDLRQQQNQPVGKEARKSAKKERGQY